MATLLESSIPRPQSCHGLSAAQWKTNHLFISWSAEYAPTSINDEGVIVGDYFILLRTEPGFMLKDGVFSNIDPPGNDGFVNVNRVSNSGAVVGSYETADATQGFAFKNGTYTNN